MLASFQVTMAPEGVEALPQPRAQVCPKYTPASEGPTVISGQPKLTSEGPVSNADRSTMNAYFVTIPMTLTEEQRNAAEGADWKISADLRSDVMAGAVPSTVIEISRESPEQAASVVAQAFGVDPDDVRVEER